jgi:membrane protein implicated in regulation of membrane protease activity
VVIAWLVLGALLLLFEMHHMAFFAMFGAIGSFAGAVVAALAPEAIPVQAGVALGVSLVGVVAVRPYVSREFDRRRAGFSVKGVHGGIVGHEGLTLDEVGAAHHVGHVQLTGERWLAVSGSGQPLAAGTVVVVTAVQGTTLVVWPVDELDSALTALPELPDLSELPGPPGPPGPPDEGAISDSEDAPRGADRRKR